MEEKKKYTVPRGEAATRAKNKFRDKAYDRMELTVPKGAKAVVIQAAKNVKLSANAYVWEAIKEKYQKDTGEEISEKYEEKA